MLTTITIIDLEHQPQQVRAKQLGTFAIHRMYPAPGWDALGYFTLTHVPTGIALCYTRTLPKAMRALGWFRALRIDWTSADRETYRTDKKMFQLCRWFLSDLKRSGVVVSL